MTLPNALYKRKKWNLVNWSDSKTETENIKCLYSLKKKYDRANNMYGQLIGTFT
jgi:hypothetical protein